MAEVPKETAHQRHHHPSASQSSLSTKKSVLSNNGHPRAPPSTIKTVITAPPWARDEPPSPTEDLLSPSITRRPSDAGRPSDATQSSFNPPPSAHSWATFAPRPSGVSSHHQHAPAGTVDDDNEDAEADSRTPTQSPPKLFMGLSIRDRSMSWLTGGARLSQDGHALNPKSANMPSPVVEEDGRLGISPGPSVNFHPSVTGGGGGGNGDGQSEFRGRALTINLPSQPTPGAMFTMHQARTPGWQTPWTPRNANPTMQGEYWNVEMANGDMPDASQSDELARDGNPWVRRRKRVRAFFLNNVYVPLLFRFINITFTTAALAIAIRIRAVEKKHHIAGAVGSSPTLVIIFAPLTLVHVLAAIYLEYFGRPLGLWRTSHKLAHTLFETTFICAWSAALSLCFDNFFTSYVPCASISSIKWYNELPRPASPISDDVVLGRHKGGVGDQICDDQLVLIVLVGIGLIMYCTNLVISLFRIFERVKGHKHGGWSTKH